MRRERRWHWRRCAVAHLAREVAIPVLYAVVAELCRAQRAIFRYKIGTKAIVPNHPPRIIEVEASVCAIVHCDCRIDKAGRRQCQDAKTRKHATCPRRVSARALARQVATKTCSNGLWRGVDHPLTAAARASETVKRRRARCRTTDARQWSAVAQGAAH